MGMRYRIESEGGQLRVVSGPGQGTLVEATLPAMREPA
jgi:signal transduction histidine kinase